jgi:hypothetical protein
MLLSIHVPKAAGNSFRVALMASYGDRLMRDYGDWAGFDEPVANERRARRTDAMRARREELLHDYDAIHGHFIPDKYIGLFPQSDFIAFFRDPYQQSLAHYYFLKRRPVREHDANREVHPEVRMLHEARMSVTDYLEWNAFYNQQTQYLGSLSIDDLAFVGLAERYAESLEQFRIRFHRDLGPPRYENVNQDRDEWGYYVSSDVRAAVKKYRAADLETYARAKEIFAKQARVVAA